MGLSCGSQWISGSTSWLEVELVGKTQLDPVLAACREEDKNITLGIYAAGSPYLLTHVCMYSYFCPHEPSLLKSLPEASGSAGSSL